MKRLIAATSVVMLIAMTSAGGQQQRPSFAGRWKVVLDPSTAGGPPGAFFVGPDFTATQDDRTLTVVRTTQASQVPGYQSAFLLDGSESKNTTSIGGQAIALASKSAWSGSKLVIVTTYRAQGFDVENTQTWSLDQSGNLNVEQKIVQGGRPSNGSWTYKKD